MLDLIKRDEFPPIVENDPTTAIYESLQERFRHEYRELVDIDKANEATKPSRLRGTSACSAYRSGISAGLFEMPSGYQHLVLVSSMDGVGIKIMVARAADVTRLRGRDLSITVNDILVQGAKPLFPRLRGGGRIEPAMIASVGGSGHACAENHRALIGGETAEMPGLYQEGDFDLPVLSGSWSATRLNGSRITPGDVIPPCCPTDSTPAASAG